MNRVLIVDDEVTMQRLFTQRFRTEIKSGELTLLFAINGEEALEVLRQSSVVDCLISDIKMPRMDGLTLLARAKEVQPTLRAIIISASDDLANIQMAMNHGASAFLTKPLDFGDLKMTLQRTLNEMP